MASLRKQAKSGLRRKAAAWLESAVNAAPGSVQNRMAPLLCYLEMLVLDYGIVRILYNNRHRISDEAWRSAQPSPHHIHVAARRGVKTVVNLRGDQSFGTTWLEQRACAQSDLKLVNLKLRSRAAPSKEELREIKRILDASEYPVLFHCKSGADRAGLMSALYRHTREGVPIAEAAKQLSLRFGHIRQADTGVLDFFFERYLADSAVAPIAFWDWVETRYDPEEVNSMFHGSSFANRIVNGILRRE